MTRRKIREEIFKLLFEKELIDNNIDRRIEEVIEENGIKKRELKSLSFLFIQFFAKVILIWVDIYNTRTL